MIGRCLIEHTESTHCCLIAITFFSILFFSVVCGERRIIIIYLWLAKSLSYSDIRQFMRIMFSIFFLFYLSDFLLAITNYFLVRDFLFLCTVERYFMLRCLQHWKLNFCQQFLEFWASMEQYTFRLRKIKLWKLWGAEPEFLIKL